MSCARRAIPGLLLAAATLSVAASPPDLGRNEFTLNCATCHGLDGHGKQGIPDLTLLASRHGGSFPYVTVYETIEGTHGGAKPASEMPKWKGHYNEEAEKAGTLAPYDVEGYLRTRINALTDYLVRIQE